MPVDEYKQKLVLKDIGGFIMIGITNEDIDKAIKLADEQIETPQYRARRMLKALDITGAKVDQAVLNAIQ